MRCRTCFAVMMVIFLSVGLSGCATLSEADLCRAEGARLEAAQQLEFFAKAVAEDDVVTAASLLAARVPPQERSRLENTLRKASWLEMYTGYTLDAAGAVSHKSARAWLGGEVELSVPAANARGLEFKDQFCLAKTAHGWAVVDFALHEPLLGEEVDLPREDKEKVRARVKWVFDRLRMKKPEQVFASLPRENASRWRTGSLSFWRRLVGGRRTVRCILDDLVMVTKFDILRWPDPDRYLPTAYMSLAEVLLVYDVPYVWPQGGISQEDNLRIEIFLRKRNEQWEYHMIRFYARGIPDSL